MNILNATLKAYYALISILIFLAALTGCDTDTAGSNKPTEVASATSYYHIVFYNTLTDASVDISVPTTENFTLPDCTDDRIGFEIPDGRPFVEWNISPYGTETSYKAGDLFNKQKKGTVITLYAIWKGAANELYYVEYDSNGGEGEMDKSTMFIGIPKALPGCTFKAPTGKRFAHWTKTEADTEPYYTDGQKVTNLTAKGKTIKLYAQWEIKTYFVITYHDENNTANTNDATFDLTHNVTLTDLGGVTGYSFAGWYDNAECNGSAVAGWDAGEVTDDTDLWAKWTANSYRIHFDANGGTGNMSEQSMTYDTEETLTDVTFSRSGYRFIGWNTDAESSESQYVSGQSVKNLTDTPNGAVVLYAIWEEADTYTVVFDANSGTGTMDNVVFVTDEDRSLPKCTFTAPVGKIFGSWNTRSDGSGDSYDNMQTVSGLAGKDETVTLYAQWIEKSFLAAYFTDEQLHTETADVTFDKLHDVELPTPTAKGHRFCGWYDNAECNGSAITGWAAGDVTGDITLYAKWEAVITTYTVKVLLQAVSGDEYEQNLSEYPDAVKDCTMDEITVETADAIYGFIALPIEQQVVVADGSAIVEIRYNRRVVSYTFDPNGGKLGSSDVAVTKEGRFGAPCSITAPTRTGYTFSGWNKFVPETFGVEDDTFTAQWTVNTYKITYNANKPSLETSAVSGTMTDTSCVYGQTCTVKANSYTLEHYTFKNWNTKSGGTGTTYTVGSAQSLAGNVTLYAQWTPKTYTITYHGDSITPWDGIAVHKTSGGSTTYTKTYSWGNSVTLTNNFVGTYTYQYLTDYWEERHESTYSTIDIEYTHAGWSVSANSTAKTYNTVQTINNCQLGDADLYALWASDKYYVIYHSNMNIGDRYCYPEDPSSSYAQWTTNDKSNAVYVASSNTSYYTLRNPSGIGDIDDYWTDSNRKFLSWSESPDGCYESAKESGKTIYLSKSKITHLYAVWYYDYSSEYNSHTYNGRTYQAAYVDDFETTVGNFYRVMGYCWIPGTLPDKTKVNWDKYPIQATNIFRIFDYCNKLSVLLGYTKCYTQSGTWNGNTATTEMNCNKTNTGYRLPDKDEWYYYASPYGWFPDSNFEYPNGQTVDNFTWYKGNSGNKYHIVGGKGSANFGMCDACGNVSELCHYSDTLVYNYSDKIQTTSADYHGYYMYVCGGDYSKEADKVKLSSYSLKDNLQNYNTNPDDFARYPDVGFRVMRRM